MIHCTIRLTVLQNSIMGRSQSENLLVAICRLYELKEVTRYLRALPCVSLTEGPQKACNKACMDIASKEFRLPKT